MAKATDAPKQRKERSDKKPEIKSVMSRISAEQYQALRAEAFKRSNKRFQADVAKLGLREGRTGYEIRSTFGSLAMVGGARREDLDLITHPSPRQASDLYTRLAVVWPALCRAVLAVRVAPRPRPAPEAATEGPGGHRYACANACQGARTRKKPREPRGFFRT